MVRERQLPLAQIVDDHVAGVGAGGDDGRCVLAIRRLRHPHHRGALLLAGVGVHEVWAACRQREDDVAVLTGNIDGARCGLGEVNLDVAGFGCGAE